MADHGGGGGWYCALKN